MKIGLRLVAPFLASASFAFAQQPAPTTAAQAPNRDTSYIDAQGTAHVTRVVPVPKTVSPEAQKFLAAPVPDEEPPSSVAERRARLDSGEAHHRVEWSRICPNHIENSTIAGVPVRIVTPDDLAAVNRDKVLLNLHGGGFDADSGSYSETIPIAGFAKMKVVAVLYRLAPEHPFPAAVDDAVAVYKELLKTYTPNHIVLYGTSAGAVLTGEVTVRLKQLGLPLPAALGIFSATGDFARAGDTEALFSVRGLAGHLNPPAKVHDAYYVGNTDPRNQVLSPVYADLHGMPPTLFVSSTRDMLLSGTSNLDRAFLRAGDKTQLVVFDGFPHAFWYNPGLPEAIEANHIMANFFMKALRR